MGVVEKSQIVNGSIADAWVAISNMGAVKDWHPNVAKVTVFTEQDSGTGASRRVEFHDGNSVVETVVEEVDHQFTKVDMTESPLIKKAFVTISTEEQTADTTKVTFSIDYSMKYGPVGWLLGTTVLKRVFKQVFPAALAGLSYHLETGNLVIDSVPDAAVK